MSKSHQMSKIALVTGGNQGLGFALVKLLAQRLEKDDVVYLCSRNIERGERAKQQLGATRASVEVLPLDVTDQASINTLAATIKSLHGGIDIVASNAAARISPATPQAEQVRQFVATNNHGSKALFEALMPLLNDNARYIMVSSSFGQLKNLPPKLHPLFDIQTLSLDDIERSMDSFVQSMENGQGEADGWGNWINIPSKIGQVATAKIGAKMLAEQRPNSGILLNAVCPGLVDTDASRPWFGNMSDAQSPDEAAIALVNLLLTKAGTNQPQGQLMQFGRALPWL